LLAGLKSRLTGSNAIFFMLEQIIIGKAIISIFFFIAPATLGGRKETHLFKENALKYR
jgi:hypothetical protein